MPDGIECSLSAICHLSETRNLLGADRSNSVFSEDMVVERHKIGCAQFMDLWSIVSLCDDRSWIVIKPVMPLSKVKPHFREGQCLFSNRTFEVRVLSL
jgi:hypothetical protein